MLNERKPRKHGPPHEHAASVDAIIAFLGKENTATYGRWLSLVKGKCYGDVMAILKQAKDLDPKYSRGGFIVNRLRSKPQGPSLESAR